MASWRKGVVGWKMYPQGAAFGLDGSAGHSLTMHQTGRHLKKPACRLSANVLFPGTTGKRRSEKSRMNTLSASKMRGEHLAVRSPLERMWNTGLQVLSGMHLGQSWPGRFIHVGGGLENSSISPFLRPFCTRKSTSGSRSGRHHSLNAIHDFAWLCAPLAADGIRCRPQVPRWWRWWIRCRRFPIVGVEPGGPTSLIIRICVDG